MTEPLTTKKKLAEALAVCHEWFAYLEVQRARAVEMQRLSALARGNPAEAQRQLRELDAGRVTVFDGGRLEPAVRYLVEMLKNPPEATEALDVLQGLASYLGAGGIDCEDPAKLDEKIRWGIAHHFTATLERAAMAVEPGKITTLVGVDMGTARDARQADVRQACAESIRALKGSSPVEPEGTHE